MFGALAFFAAPAFATSIADFTDPALSIGGSSFSVTLNGGAADGTVLTFDNPFQDCSAGCATTDSGPQTFTGFSGFRNSSGLNTGLYDVTFSNSVSLVGATAVDSMISDFLGLAISGTGVSESGVFAGLTSPGFANLGTPITFLAGETYTFDVQNTLAPVPGFQQIGGVEFGTWAFEAVGPAPVPLPASSFLLLAGLGALTRLRARAKRS